MSVSDFKESIVNWVLLVVLKPNRNRLRLRAETPTLIPHTNRESFYRKAGREYGRLFSWSNGIVKPVILGCCAEPRKIGPHPIVAHLGQA